MQVILRQDQPRNFRTSLAKSVKMRFLRMVTGWDGLSIVDCRNERTKNRYVDCTPHAHRSLEIGSQPGAESFGNIHVRISATMRAAGNP